MARSETTYDSPERGPTSRIWRPGPPANKSVGTALPRRLPTLPGAFSSRLPGGRTHRSAARPLGPGTRPSKSHFASFGHPRATVRATADGVTRTSACGCVLVTSEEGRREV